MPRALVGKMWVKNRAAFRERTTSNTLRPALILLRNSPEGTNAEQIEARKIFEQGNELARKDEDQPAADIYQKAISLDPISQTSHLLLAMEL